MDSFKKNESITIDGEGLSLRLRAANEDDLENLRQWKNDHRAFFFHKMVISPEQQRAWFNTFKTRSDDFMFIVEVNNSAIGCMGIRLLGEVWDIYNVILGLPDYRKKGYMGKALQAMLNFAQSGNHCPMTLQVLQSNPAVAWYKKNGFVITGEHSDHFSMAYQPNNG